MKSQSHTAPEHVGLTAEEVQAHFGRWRSQVGPSGSTYRKLAESAIERLYERTGMHPPAIFWCQSFYQMLTLPSVVLGILHSNIWDGFAGSATTEADNKSWTRKWNQAWPEIWMNAGMPLLEGMNRTTRLAHNYGQLEGPLISQAKRELGKALRSGRLEYVQSKLNRDMYRRYWARIEGPNFAKAHWGHTKHDVYAEMVYIRNRNFELEGWRELEPFDSEFHAISAGVSGLFNLLAMRLGAEPAAQERFMIHLPSSVPWIATADLLVRTWPEQCERIKHDVQIWLDLNESCSAIMCLDGLAFVCERASAFHLSQRRAPAQPVAPFFIAPIDDGRRLHNPSGPALIYEGDGFAEYARDGVIVPAFIIEAPESITVDHIDKSDNAEVRRVMLDIYGVARYLQDARIAPIQQDDFGTLYRKEMPGDEPLVMVKVVNSTPEPDGTFKDYFLRVPPNMESAKQAVAWTFDLDEDDYEPDIQT